MEYVERLGRLNERVKDKLVLVPRIYTNKPRTRGVGYKGMFSQPDPTKSEDILKGIFAIRELNIKAIEASGLSAADEMLYPANIHYVDDPEFPGRVSLSVFQTFFFSNISHKST